MKVRYIEGENQMNEYIKLLRVKHYIKNTLIFIPLFLVVVIIVLGQ